MNAEQHYADLIIRQALRIRDLRQAMIRARSECDHDHPRAARCILNDALEDSKSTILAHVPVGMASIWHG